MKKRLFALAASFGVPLAMFAEGNNTPFDSVASAIGTQLTSWSTSITTFFTDNLGVILGLVGLALGVSLVWVVLALFRKATNKAK